MAGYISQQYINSQNIKDTKHKDNIQQHNNGLLALFLRDVSLIIGKNLDAFITSINRSIYYLASFLLESVFSKISKIWK